MANIPIWPGSSSFSKGDTPFGFYDKDTEFTSSAPQVADWCARRLGYPLVDIELQAVNFFTCFEEAVNEYGSQLYHFQIINNFHTLEGTSTRSGSASLNEQVVTPNLGNTINVAEQYGSEADGAGGNYKLEKGTLNVIAGQQGYDLLSDVSSSLSGSEDVYLKRVYHYAPAAINRYFDPYAGTGTGIQSLMQSFGFGNYSPGVNFMLMPMYFDVLKLQAIELNDAIRKSAYHFDVEDNRYLKLFPIPTSNYTLHYEYQLKSVANNPVKHPSELGSKVTNLSNAPYSNPVYTNINEPGRQWIRRYALALAKEMLGSVRGKYQSVPIPGDTTTLDFGRLLSEAAAEKTTLIEELKTFLEETTRVKQLERQNQEAQLTQETFYKVPYPIYVG